MTIVKYDICNHASTLVSWVVMPSLKKRVLQHVSRANYCVSLCFEPVNIHFCCSTCLTPRQYVPVPNRNCKLPVGTNQQNSVKKRGPSNRIVSFHEYSHFPLNHGLWEKESSVLINISLLVPLGSSFQGILLTQGTLKKNPKNDRLMETPIGLGCFRKLGSMFSKWIITLINMV